MVIKNFHGYYEFFFFSLEFLWPPGTTLLIGLNWQVGAEDHDSGANGAIHFSIASGDELGHFAMDGQFGDLTVAKPLDREKVSAFLFHFRKAE